MNHLAIKAGSLFPNTHVKGLDDKDVNLGEISPNAQWKMVVVIAHYAQST